MWDESGPKNIGLRMNKTDYRDLQVKCLVTALTQKSQFDDTLNNAYFRRIQQNIPEEKFSTLSHHVRGWGCPKNRIDHLEVKTWIAKRQQDLLDGKKLANLRPCIDRYFQYIEVQRG